MALILSNMSGSRRSKQTTIYNFLDFGSLRAFAHFSGDIWRPVSASQNSVPGSRLFDRLKTPFGFMWFDVDHLEGRFIDWVGREVSKISDGINRSVCAAELSSDLFRSEAGRFLSRCLLP
jgi:hypothetical protein